MAAISLASGTDGEACHIIVAADVTGRHIRDTMWETSEKHRGQTKSPKTVDKVTNKKHGRKVKDWIGLEQDLYSGDGQVRSTGKQRFKKKTIKLSREE